MQMYSSFEFCARQIGAVVSLLTEVQYPSHSCVKKFRRSHHQGLYFLNDLLAPSTKLPNIPRVLDGYVGGCWSFLVVVVVGRCCCCCWSLLLLLMLLLLLLFVLFHQ